MAVTNIVRNRKTIPEQERTYAQNGNEYTGLSGVNQNTASNLGTYQQGYKPSENVQRAQQNLENTMANKPGEFNSKYAEQLDQMLQEITNPQDFNYSFDGDELFKSYADRYTQLGKQASLDTMGQAAALTGGYGNSYAQAAANQAYQQYLLGLYDKGMELSQQAYQRNKDKTNDAMNRYSMLSGQDATDYARYQDRVANWQNDRDFAAQMMQAAQSGDYQAYQDALQYWTGLANIENAAWNTEQEREEAIRQYNQDFQEKVRQYDTTMAENQRQYDTTLAWNQEESWRDYYENQRQFNENLNWDKEESWRDYYENQRQFNENLNWDKEESYRDYYENQRQYDTTLAENQRQFNENLAWDKEESTRDFNENVRQYDTTLAENQRQYDTTLAENQRQYDTTMDWNQESYNRDMAYDYVTAILAAGGTPSAELLEAAWLSPADAEALRAQVTGGGGGNGGNPNSFENMYPTNYDYITDAPEKANHEGIIDEEGQTGGDDDKENHGKANPYRVR